MPDTTNGPLDPADPPETQPPGSEPEPDPSSDFIAADPPETQPPKNT